MPWFTPQAAYAAWDAQFEAARAQLRRLSPGGDSSDADRWRSRVGAFSPTERAPEGLERLVELIGEQGSVLDIGAGGGRFAVPLAARVRHVTAIDGSPAMTEALRTHAATIGNLDVLEPQFWPPEDTSAVPTLEVTFNSHVVYFVPDIAAFLDAMERHATRLCIVLAGDRPGGSPPAGAFEAAHGEPPIDAPAAHELVAVLAARHALFSVQRFHASTVLPGDPMELLRSRLNVREGTPQDERLQSWLRAQDHDALGMTRSTAIISWPPAAEA